ncbi:MAG TPA: phosphoribosylanthranilate isomerase [Gemmatimonadaceae bacterium]
MGVEIKFCGLTRPQDAAVAVELGASYVGAIFASGPRLISPERAATVFADVPSSVRRVGVFGEQSADDILRAIDTATLNVVQLHGGGDLARIDAIQRRFDGDIWAVVRIPGIELPANFEVLATASDGLLLDAYVPGALGGTGVALPWNALRDAVDGVRPITKIILAGGLKPENVAQAIAALSPDVVDVSSGVEDAPGIKNHHRMRAFRDAVAHISIPT